jgi:hypothetical protein
MTTGEESKNGRVNFCAVHAKMLKAGPVSRCSYGTDGISCCELLLLEAGS